jgi:hypothetical protein
MSYILVNERLERTYHHPSIPSDGITGFVGCRSDVVGIPSATESHDGFWKNV